MKHISIIGLTLLLATTIIMAGCEKTTTRGSDEKQQAMQEALLQEATAQTGMPAVKNFRERRILKDIIEMRDQASISTYTYLYSDMQGKLVFACNSVGYGIPVTTQYTNPEKIAERNTYQSGSYAILPQADPNGLFSGYSAGTWVLCKDPKGDKVAPVLFEPNVIVSQFRLQ